MKRILALLAIVLVAGCASSAISNAGPPLQLTLLQRGAPIPDVFYFRGPVNVAYDLAIRNPTNEQYTLSRLDIRSIDAGAYRIRTGSQPMRQRVNPNGVTSVHLSTWAQSTGGFISSGEPVSVRVIAQFDGPGGRFQKVFTQTLSQFGE
jgi:hypothetical protein